MNIAFVLQVIWAFALVALLLVGMVYVGRAFQRGRIVGGLGRRLVTTIESTALAQNVTVHVVRVGDKYFLVGGGSAGVAMLAELPASEIEPYIESHRAALEAQRDDAHAPLRTFQEIMTARKLPWILGGLAAAFIVFAALAPAFAQTIPGPTAPTIPIPRINIGITPATKPADVAFSLQILLLLTVLTLAPTLLVLMTSFTRIVVVLSFVRTALGTQSNPPNQVLVGLAMFLTFFVMIAGDRGHQQERPAAVSGQEDLAVGGARTGREAVARLHVQADPRKRHRALLLDDQRRRGRPSRRTSRPTCWFRRS